MKLALALVVVACSSKTPPETTKPAMEQHHMSPELAKFHDVLAPRWHADKARRMTDTCAAMADFTSTAAAVGSKDLADAVTALDGTCKANDAAAFEPAFEKVHTTFHKLMEGGEHGEHEMSSDH